MRSSSLEVYSQVTLGERPETVASYFEDFKHAFSSAYERQRWLVVHPLIIPISSLHSPWSSELRYASAPIKDCSNVLTFDVLTIKITADVRCFTRLWGDYECARRMPQPKLPLQSLWGLQSAENGREQMSVKRKGEKERAKSRDRSWETSTDWRRMAEDGRRRLLGVRGVYQTKLVGRTNRLISSLSALGVWPYSGKPTVHQIACLNISLMVGCIRQMKIRSLYIVKSCHMVF